MPYDFIINTAVTLFVVIDPLGLAPIFVGVTDGMTTAQRREVAARATIIAIIVLVATLFVGKPLLAALGITLPAFRVAGGLLLFWIAAEMVFEKRTERKGSSAKEQISRDHLENIAAFPLAVPLMAGPGAITATILLSGQAGGDPVRLAALCAVLVAVLATCFVTYLLAARIEKLLGITGRVVLTRLLGVILAALAVQFVADGTAALIHAG
ncbi:MAG: MarC family protein [Rhodobiaceae bacterium]|nr:MarC family protein [Rhodobiaceae bacterium]MCC0052803.1 MarC family protein [Rhodobiaceae bacterium]